SGNRPPNDHYCHLKPPRIAPAIRGPWAIVRLIISDNKAQTPTAIAGVKGNGDCRSVAPGHHFRGEWHRAPADAGDADVRVATRPVGVDLPAPEGALVVDGLPRWDVSDVYPSLQSRELTA